MHNEKKTSNCMNRIRREETVELGNKSDIFDRFLSDMFFYQGGGGKLDFG